MEQFFKIPTHILLINHRFYARLFSTIPHYSGISLEYQVASKFPKLFLHNSLRPTRISHGRYVGHDIIIPRIPLIPSNSTLPFEFRRLQFPVALCFAMTINKSQGQTFKAVGVDLTNESFTHGMLHVALSRIGSPNCLMLLAREGFKTHNVVYNEVFN